MRSGAELFRRRGFSASSMRELAQMMGIQKATLYHHMKSKEALLFDICITSLGKITAEVGRVARSAPADTRLEAMIKAHVNIALTDRDMHAVMLFELKGLSPESRSEVIRMRDAYEQLFEEVIGDDQEAGRLRTDVDAKYLRLALLNLLNWTIVWYDERGDSGTPADLGTLFADLFVNGAAARDDR